MTIRTHIPISCIRKEHLINITVVRSEMSLPHPPRARWVATGTRDLGPLADASGTAPALFDPGLGTNRPHAITNRWSSDAVASSHGSASLIETSATF